MPTYQPMHHPLHALACTLPVYYYQRGALPSLTNQCIISALCIPLPLRSDSVTVSTHLYMIDIPYAPPSGWFLSSGRHGRHHRGRGEEGGRHDT